MGSCQTPDIANMLYAHTRHRTKTNQTNTVFNNLWNVFIWCNKCDYNSKTFI